MNQKNWKRMAAGAMAVLICASALTGCGAKNDTGSAQKDTNVTVAKGPEVTKEVVKVNDQEISVGEFQYYVYNTAMMKAYSIDSGFTGDPTTIDWDQKTESGKTLAEDVVNEALDTAIAEVLTVQKGKENGVENSADQQSQADQAVDSFIGQSGQEQFDLTANAMAINSADDYKKLYNRMMTVQAVQDDIQANPDKYMTNKDELKKYKSDKKATVQHILIMNDSDKVDDPKAAIDQVLARAKAGEDFYQLMQEFNEDTGETEAGYTFGPGEMVKEFEEAAFALDYDQISEVVQSEYGYHIIKRLVGTAELQNYWKESAKIEKNDKVIKEISVQEITQAAANAQKKLQEQSKSSAASSANTGAAGAAGGSQTTDGNGGNANG